MALAESARALLRQLGRMHACSLYWLYRYKRTNTDAQGAADSARALIRQLGRTHAGVKCVLKYADVC
jgi:hypothetical protein